MPFAAGVDSSLTFPFRAPRGRGPRHRVAAKKGHIARPIAQQIIMTTHVPFSPTHHPIATSDAGFPGVGPFAPHNGAQRFRSLVVVGHASMPFSSRFRLT
jgi:hypothetical protein